ncbi:DUF2786 domain-containing protein [Nocardia sp. CA-120079]|uniref:DUF2786 domain-containing protein n=1 Tax=Nocardia sp. CA-120079 TaxID=3239974 RepID=UPI003D95CA51
MATERTRDTMTKRIGALLARADNATTPEEADACRDKAFALIAKEGISESEARGTLREGNNVVEALTFQITGKYIAQQRYLLGSLCTALHCTAVLIERSRTSQKVKIFGVKIHTDRVRLLYSILNISMMATAARLTPPTGHRQNTHGYRIDWMFGYASRIGERLSAAEELAASERDTESGTTTQALVLVSDAERAEAAQVAAYPKTKSTGYSREVRKSTYDQGRAAGDRADLADRGQLRGRRAIGD